MKILVIGDIHTGKSRKSSTYPGIIRQANDQAEQTLQALIPRFNYLKPDLLIHMGDALRDIGQNDQDKSNLTKSLELLKLIDAPQIHLLGNHELTAFSREELIQIYNQVGVSPEFYGSKEFDNFRIIWLDCELIEGHKGKIPEKTLQWLKSLNGEGKPSIVFTHYSVVPVNGAGTFYFEQHPEEMMVDNAQALLAALEKVVPVVNINAHVHLLSHQQINNKHYISNPSFTENIAGGSNIKINPGIYSILDVDQDKFVFSSYSHQFCFAKIQGQLNY